MPFQLAERIANLPPYPFAEIDRMKAEVKKRGVDIISLGIGDPDLPTPQHIIETLKVEADKQPNHMYAPYEGIQAFRESGARWYERRHGLKLNPDTEVVNVIGTKEGIAHFPLAFVNPGDIVLVPDPGYPVYATSTLFAGGEPVRFPLRESNGFLPDLKEIEAIVGSAERLKRVKAIWINYPNNPTGATCELSFYNELVAWARKHNIIVCADSAYTELTYDGWQAPSFLAADGAMEVGIEFQSLSKTYNMTGWRVGWAAGNATLVQGLGKIKTNVDSGQFMAIQHAAVTALESSQACVHENIVQWQERRDIIVDGLRELGFEVEKPRGTFYIWTKTPKGYTPTETVKKLINETGVVCTPGTAFGIYGDGYIRFAYCLSADRLREALARMKTVQW